ncbi:MAG: nitroreductase/quinone reductase family protein [Microthrixaceae bacterium]
MKTPDKILEIGSWCLENGHRAALRLSGGRFPKRVIGMTPVEIHTTGRRSGASPFDDADRTDLRVGSDRDHRVKGGHSDHPDWYKNLSANPTIDITAQGVTSAYVTRTASAEEKSEVWPQITSVYKGYEGYQNNTDRDIPVVICTPVEKG